MLGALAHLVLFGEKPPKVGGLYEWSSRAEDPFEGALTEFIKRALCKEPGERFENAREMLEAFNAATARKQESIIDLTTFEAYKAATRDRDYEETETLADTDDAWFLSLRGTARPSWSRCGSGWPRHKEAGPSCPPAVLPRARQTYQGLWDSWNAAGLRLWSIARRNCCSSWSGSKGGH